MLEKGTQVVILPTNSYNNLFAGMRGTIAYWSYLSNTYAVDLGKFIRTFSERELSVVLKSESPWHLNGTRKKYDEHKIYVKNDLDNMHGL